MWERYTESRSTERYRADCKARKRKEKEKQVAESTNTNSKNFRKFLNRKRKNKSGKAAPQERQFTTSNAKDKTDVPANF